MENLSGFQYALPVHLPWYLQGEGPFIHFISQHDISCDPVILTCKEIGVVVVRVESQVSLHHRILRFPMPAFFNNNPDPAGLLPVLQVIPEFSGCQEGILINGLFRDIELIIYPRRIGKYLIQIVAPSEYGNADTQILTSMGLKITE